MMDDRGMVEKKMGGMAGRKEGGESHVKGSNAIGWKEGWVIESRMVI